MTYSTEHSTFDFFDGGSIVVVTALDFGSGLVAALNNTNSSSAFIGAVFTAHGIRTITPLVALCSKTWSSMLVSFFTWVVLIAQYSDMHPFSVLSRHFFK